MSDSARYRTFGRLHPEQEPGTPVSEVDDRACRHFSAPIFSIQARAFHEQVKRETCPEGQAA